MLLLDECIPVVVVKALALLEVPFEDVRALGLRGVDDQALAHRAQQAGAIFVTYDLDFTTQRALLAAMAAVGVCVVMIRRSKVRGASHVRHGQETAMLILRHFREDWPRSCGHEAVVISCSVRGNRARTLSSLPWYRRPSS
ncbi:MAG: DUF5615 family PIN-like protein [Chloroflexota bacterium]